MEALARSISGSSILVVGAQFTLFGASSGFDGFPEFFIGILGLALVGFGLFVLTRMVGLSLKSGVLSSPDKTPQ